MANTDYTLYHIVTGVIAQSGDAPDPTLLLPDFPDHDLILGEQHSKDEERINPETKTAYAFKRPLTDIELQVGIDNERDDRIENRFIFNEVSYQLNEKGISRITSMGTLARFAILDGAEEGDYFWDGTGDPFGFIATDNTTTPMDAQTMDALAKAATRWVKHHTLRGRNMKSMDPIPSDPDNDDHWAMVNS